MKWTSSARLVLKLDPSPGVGGNGRITPPCREVLKSDKEIKREQPEQSRNDAASAGRLLSAYAGKLEGHDSGNCDHRRQNKLELR